MIAIYGMPRSGTSFLGQVFDSSPHVSFRMEPFFSYQFKNLISKDMSESYFNLLLNDILKENKNDFMNQEDKRKSGVYPKFSKIGINSQLVIKSTRHHHLLEKMIQCSPESKFIFIVRDPRATISSWINHPREFPQNLDPLDYWDNGSCRNKCEEEFWGFNDWLRITKLHLALKEQYDNVYLVKYEELVEGKLNVTKDIFKFCNLDFTEQTFNFLKESEEHNQDPYSVFRDRSVIFSWKENLPVEIQTKIVNEVEKNELDEFLINI